MKFFVMCFLPTLGLLTATGCGSGPRPAPIVDSNAGGNGSAQTGGTAGDGAGGTPTTPVDAGHAGANAGAGPCRDYDFTALTARLENAVADGVVPGVGLVVVTAECSAPLYQHAAGNQTESSVLELASASKLFATALLLRLAERGSLSLDDTVSKFIPNWPPDKQDITVRQLLSHTSGLPPNSACLADTTSTLEACAAAIAQEPLVAKPGTAFNYGGSSFQVAGRIAEIAGGQPWNMLFAQLLAQPCGLAETSFAPSAANHLGSSENPRIAGGAASNLADYGAFLPMFLRAGACGANQVLQSSALADLSRDELAGVTIGSSPLPKAWGYGLGLWREPPEADQPVTLFSDPGAFGAYPWIDAGRGYVAFLLVKKNLKASLGLVGDLRVAINSALAR